MIRNLDHLVFVRHGQSEGDVRRAARKRGEIYITNKLPEEENLTTLGYGESHLDGRLVTKHIIKALKVEFDNCFTSPSLRSEQSAAAMDLTDAVWNADEALDERHRGLIRGLTSGQHAALYTESFKQMKEDPLGWIPPGGESIRAVSVRIHNHLDNIDNLKSVLAVTHRDLMWAAMQPIEELSDDELLLVNTDEIVNGQIIHYTSIDPVSGEKAPALMWKRIINPTEPESVTDWQILENVARKVGELALD